MPKIEGRASTRKTVKIDGLLIGSFIMPHETKYDKRTCVIEGCDHKIGPTIEEIKEGWEPCLTITLPGFACRQIGEIGNRTFKSVGVVCPCHAAEILDAEA